MPIAEFDHPASRAHLPALTVVRIILPLSDGAEQVGVAFVGVDWGEDRYDLRFAERARIDSVKHGIEFLEP